MLADEMREILIPRALRGIGLYSPAAHVLVYATGLIETNYEHIKQVKGVAKGPYQFEDSAYFSIKTYLTNGIAKGLLGKVLDTIGRGSLPVDPDFLMWDWMLATIFCRVYYYQIKKPLPDQRDAQKMWEMYKQYYNSKLGAATQERCLPLFEKAIEQCLT